MTLANVLKCLDPCNRRVKLLLPCCVPGTRLSAPTLVSAEVLAPLLIAYCRLLMLSCAGRLDRPYKWVSSHNMSVGSKQNLAVAGWGGREGGRHPGQWTHLLMGLAAGKAGQKSWCVGYIEIFSCGRTVHRM